MGIQPVFEKKFFLLNSIVWLGLSGYRIKLTKKTSQNVVGCPWIYSHRILMQLSIKWDIDKEVCKNDN
jgi:hypothetical protein